MYTSVINFSKLSTSVCKSTHIKPNQLSRSFSSLSRSNAQKVRSFSRSNTMLCLPTQLSSFNRNKRTYHTMPLLSTIPIHLKKKRTFKRNIKRHLAMANVIKTLTNTLIYEIHFVKPINENHFLFPFTRFVANFSPMHIFDFNKSVTMNFNKSLTIINCNSKTLQGYIFRHAALSLRIALLDYHNRINSNVTPMALSKSPSASMDLYLLTTSKRYKTILEINNDIKHLRFLFEKHD